MPEKLYTVADAAAHWGCSPCRIRAKIKLLGMEPRRVGMMMILSERELLALKPQKSGRPAKRRK